MTQKKVFDQEVHSFSSYGTSYPDMVRAVNEFNDKAVEAGATTVYFTLEYDEYDRDYQHLHCTGYRMFTEEEAREAAAEKEASRLRQIENLNAQLSRLKGNS